MNSKTSKQTGILVRVISTGEYALVDKTAICTRPFPDRGLLKPPAVLPYAPSSGSCVGCCPARSLTYMPGRDERWFLCEVAPLLN